MIEIKKKYIIRNKEEFETIHEELSEYYSTVKAHNSRKAVVLSIKLTSGENLI